MSETVTVHPESTLPPRTIVMAQHRVHFHSCRIGRHNDRATFAEQFARVRHRLTKIARGRRDDVRVGNVQCDVVCRPKLEAAGPLKGLGCQEDIDAQVGTESGRLDDSRRTRRVGALHGRRVATGGSDGGRHGD